MTPKQYREALDRVGLSQVGAAHFFFVNQRTSRRWASGEQPVPRTIEIILWLMMKFKVRWEDVP